VESAEEERLLRHVSVTVTPAAMTVLRIVMVLCMVVSVCVCVCVEPAGVAFALDNAVDEMVLPAVAPASHTALSMGAARKHAAVAAPAVGSVCGGGAVCVFVCRGGAVRGGGGGGAVCVCVRERESERASE
jgi:hypothetical protein